MLAFPARSASRCPTPAPVASKPTLCPAVLVAQPTEPAAARLGSGPGFSRSLLLAFVLLRLFLASGNYLSGSGLRWSDRLCRRLLGSDLGRLFRWSLPLFLALYLFLASGSYLSGAALVEQPLAQAPARERSRQAVPLEPAVFACALPVSRQRELPFRERRWGSGRLRRRLLGSHLLRRSLLGADCSDACHTIDLAPVRGTSAFSSALALRIVHLHLLLAPGNAAARTSYRRPARARACRSHRPKQRAAPTPSARRELCLQECDSIFMPSLLSSSLTNTPARQFVPALPECGARWAISRSKVAAFQTSRV